MLEEANKSHPGAWWWIKGDGTDVTAGLGESVKHIWSGDVDLADGKGAGTVWRLHEPTSFCGRAWFGWKAGAVGYQ